MKRRKLLIYWSALQGGISLMGFLAFLLVQHGDTAIIPPPWSDPEKNPCASMPGGWQLLYWPPLKKCFKIFSTGYPCPETMELAPTVSIGSSKKKTMANAPIAECRCPPGTVLSSKYNKCYKIFERGPCNKGQYFSPIAESQLGNKRTNRWGVCKTPKICPNNMLFWPVDGKCYTKLTKGPCTKGKLLVLNEEHLAECQCENSGELEPYFYDVEETCHEHFTKGPCSTPGHLFLPGAHCDCHRFLPQYHEAQQMCYELNTLGPCPPGHVFIVSDNVSSNESESSGLIFTPAKCQCKHGYVPWLDGHCYRLYTRGPCAKDEFIINSTTCIRNFCGKNRLYFPDQKECYRIGSQGPCDLYQVVVFDFTARPSVDGISYNGMCGCAGVVKNLNQQCSTPEETIINTCESTPGMIELEGICHKLYTRGPCGPGQWLEPIKSLNMDISRSIQTKAKCVCRPGYTPAEKRDNMTMAGVQHCNAPTVGLASENNQPYYECRFHKRICNKLIQNTWPALPHHDNDAHNQA